MVCSRKAGGVRTLGIEPCTFRWELNTLTTGIVSCLPLTFFLVLDPSLLSLVKDEGKQRTYPHALPVLTGQGHIFGWQGGGLARGKIFQGDFCRAKESDNMKSQHKL